MKIVQSPHAVLSQKAKPVKIIDAEIKQLLKAMAVALASAKDPEGVGLAAPQIGKSLQIFLIKESPEAPLMTFINPKIERFFANPKKTNRKTVKKKERGVQLEGCLSIKDIWGVVKRNYGVVITYQDETGTKHEKEFVGFMATIVQHEYDHLQGILFPKRVLEQNNPLYKAVKNKAGETEFEEVKL